MCACGKRAKDCAVGLMTSFISWSVFGMDWSADLGLLVGIKGRFKWGQRVEDWTYEWRHGGGA